MDFNIVNVSQSTILGLVMLKNGCISYCVTFGHLALAAAFALGAGTCCAEPNPASGPSKTDWSTDGTVYSIQQTSNRIILGGTFNWVGLPSGGGVVVSGETAAWDSAVPLVDGIVNTAISDGVGGWFIGGLFSNVGGFNRSNLAHVRQDRTVDPSWTTGSAGPLAAGGVGQLGGEVLALSLSGGTLYIGGRFTSVGGQPRNRLAAVDSRLGLSTSWAPQVDSPVGSIAVFGSRVFVAGAFTNLGGFGRMGLGALDAVTGSTTGWNPQADGPTSATVLVGSTDRESVV